MSGMCNLDCLTAISCACLIFSGPYMPNIPPTSPLRMLSSTPLLTTEPVATPPPGVTRFNCPIFSSKVILLISVLTNDSMRSLSGRWANKEMLPKSNRQHEIVFDNSIQLKV